MASAHPATPEMPRTVYDEVPYPSAAVSASHPNRLAGVARLYGLQAVAPSRARVLEIGCSDGSNLLAMAERAPQGSFLGFDTAAARVAEGRQAVAAARLYNLELRYQDMMTFDVQEGGFDYIIAHGMLSWVPQPVQEKIFAIVAAHLNPHGVAFITYNALPAADARRSLRELLRFHTRELVDPWAQIRRAREIVQLLLAATANSTEPQNVLLRRELKSIEEGRDGYLASEFLGSENHFFYFHEFVARAERHGLKHLGESTFATTLTVLQSPATQEVLAREPAISRAQYLDFLHYRPFRQSLLYRASAVVQPEEGAGGLRMLAFTPGFEAPVGGVDLSEGVAVAFTRKGEYRFDSANPLCKAACRILTSAPETAIAFHDLLRQARELATPYRATGDTLSVEADEALLLQDLMYLCRHALVELYAEPIAGPTAPLERPHAGAVARYAAARGDPITNRLHRPMLVDAFSREVLAACDGRRDLADLIALLVPRFAAGEFKLLKDDQLVQDPGRLHELLKPKIAAVVADLARRGLVD